MKFVFPSKVWKTCLALVSKKESCMQRITSLLLPVLTLLTIGCGYHFSASAPITLPRGVADIYIQNVENSTLESWIDPYLRTKFRDELTRRAKVNWVDPDKAQAYVNLTVIYSTDTELSGGQDQTLRSRATVTMETEFRSQVDGSLLWSSGPVTVSETFEEGTSEIVAGERAIEDAIRSIVDGLGADY